MQTSLRINWNFLSAIFIVLLCNISHAQNHPRPIILSKEYNNLINRTVIYEKTDLQLKAHLNLNIGDKPSVILILDHGNEETVAEETLELNNTISNIFVYTLDEPITMYDFEVDVILNTRNKTLEITVTEPVHIPSQRALDSGESIDEPEILIEAVKSYREIEYLDVIKTSVAHEKVDLELAADLKISNTAKEVTITLDHYNGEKTETVELERSFSNIFKYTATKVMVDGFEVNVTLNTKDESLHIEVLAPQRPLSQRAIDLGEAQQEPQILIKASGTYNKRD